MSAQASKPVRGEGAVTPLRRGKREKQERYGQKHWFSRQKHGSDDRKGDAAFLTRKKWKAVSNVSVAVQTYWPDWQIYGMMRMGTTIHGRRLALFTVVTRVYLALDLHRKGALQMVGWSNLIDLLLLLTAIATLFYTIGKRKWPPRPR